MTSPVTPWALGLAVFLFFMLGIQFPEKVNFDEFHYMPAVREFLTWNSNRNWEHPPLAKYLMTFGVWLVGDNPIGWRWMSALFGAITWVGVVQWSRSLFQNIKLSFWVGAITLVNCMLYVQSRIGMLDTFMMGFLIWGFVYWTEILFWDSPKEISVKALHRNLSLGGILFGLAGACKWFSVIPWLFFLGGLFLGKLAGFRYAKFLKNTSWMALFGFGILVPILVYLMSFLPLLTLKQSRFTLWTDLAEVLRMQIEIYQGQLRVVSNHPYMSHWWDWVFLKRPIWYAFDNEGENKEWVRGVFLIGNPLLLWSALLVWPCSLWLAFQRKSWLYVFLAGLYFACIASWIFIPRKIAFFYYYYPAVMVLGPLTLAVLQSLNRPKVKWIYLAGATVLFIYFFPILSAIRIPADSFRNWMWFRSWI